MQNAMGAPSKFWATEEVIEDLQQELQSADAEKAKELFALNAREDWTGEEYARKMVKAINDATTIPYFAFELEEGYGVQYGHCVNWSVIEEDIHEGRILKLDAGDTWPELPEAVEYVLEVNDHGNTSLYDRDSKEIWAVV